MEFHMEARGESSTDDMDAHKIRMMQIFLQDTNVQDYFEACTR
jgi:hypothetical protein